MERTVFVSYSQRQSQIKDLFVQLLLDLGFRPEVFDYGNPSAPVDREADLIRSCEGFIGLLTREETHNCSPAVIQEIGIARAEEKPMQLFAFDEIDLEAVPGAQLQTTAKITLKNRSPDEPLLFDAENARLLFKAMYEFSTRMTNVYEKKGEETFFYKSFKIEQKLVSESEIYLKNTIAASTKTRLATHTHEGSLFCDRGQQDGVMLKDSNWNFRLLQPRGTEVKLRVVTNSREFFRFLFDFVPPIEAGTDIRYGYDRRHENFFPYTLEELQEAIASKQISHRLMVKHKMVGQDFRVTRPTDHLEIVMEFPTGYPIEETEVLACEAFVDDPNRAESERASRGMTLSHDEFDDVYTLRLEVEQPRMNCTYFLLYRPPSQNEIKHV